MEVRRGMGEMTRFSRKEKSWMMYDWATSAYSVIITTAVFPVYYTFAATNAGIDSAQSTAYLGYAVSIATFILAMLSPVLGTIADYCGFKKNFSFSFL